MKHLYDFDHYLTESKNVADSYHFTNLKSLRNIITTGIRFSTRKYERTQQESGWRNRLSKRNDDYTKYISLTRHKMLGKFLSEDRELPVRITLNTAAITNHYKIVPIDFVGQVTDTAEKSHKHKGDMAMVASIAANAFEERIISPKKDEAEEYLSLKYINKIDIFMNSATSQDKEIMNSILSELSQSGIAHEVHMSYPKYSAKIKTEYNLQGIELVDGLTLDKVKPSVRKTLSGLIAHVKETLKSDCVKFSLMHLVTSYVVRGDGDLPYYDENPSEKNLYTATIDTAGILIREKYDYTNGERFHNIMNKPYIIDDYMNDKIKAYSGKELIIEIDYHQHDEEIVISRTKIAKPQVVNASIMFDIVSTILPCKKCFVILPPELMRYNVETMFDKRDFYSIDTSNPARVNYTPELYSYDD